MSLRAFIASTDAIISQRGKDYYLDDCVSELKKVSATKWTAKVLGNRKYNTHVEIDEHEVDGWGCTCPYEGDVCKHVIATCYAIIEVQNNPAAKPPQTDNYEAKIKQIVQSLSRAELEAKIIELLSKSPTFQEAFVLQQLDKVLEVSKYSHLVDSICKGSIDNSVLYTKCESLLVSADNLISQKKASETWEICRLLMEKAVPLMSDLDEEQLEETENGEFYDYDYDEDDYDEEHEYYYSSLINSIRDTIRNIASAADSTLRTTIFKWCMEGLAEELDCVLEECLLGLAGVYISGDDEDAMFLELLDIKISNQDEEEVTCLSMEALLEIKINHLKSTSREPEAWQIVEQHKYIRMFRLLLIDKYTHEGKYEEAKELCIQSINDPEIPKQGKADYYKALLTIAELEKDIALQKDYLQTLFFINSYDMKYFKRLKNLVGTEAWQKVSEEIEQKIAKSKGSYYNQKLADIYVENSDYGKLLNLLKQTYGDSLLFMDYGRYAAMANESEFVDCYQNMMRKNMEQTGRSTYEHVASHLNNLLSITNKPRLITAMVDEFKKKYINRRAMIEILNREFAELR